MTTATEVRERPILFSGPMVRAILDGSKTQTRRVVRWPEWVEDHEAAAYHLQAHGGIAFYRDGHPERRYLNPYGQPGDRLWVREAFARIDNREFGGNRFVEYRADTDASHPGGWDNAPEDPAALRWKPSIHMPRTASRITVEVTDVRVERVQDITEADAIAEGVHGTGGHPDRGCFTYRGKVDAFAQLWEDINGPRGFGWNANPWVWVLTFRRVD